MASAVAEFDPEEESKQAYFRDGERRALALGNRGPVRFGADGKLHPDIAAAYSRTGFYIFEGVLGSDELADLKAGFFEVFDRLPVDRTASVDREGRPALGADLAGPSLLWSKPLGDPLGGTSFAGGRQPVRMDEPKPAEGLPDEVPYLVMGALQFSEEALRVAGHPDLLKIAAAINGEDFVPHSEAFVVKKPGEGASFAWHQDGTTHWDSPDWTPFIHGFNFMAQLFDCTAANALWYVPGTHASGRVDIRSAVEAAGGNRLPEAVPLICKAGDVAISNRQLLHGSFANTSPDWRVTLNLGFHPRASVLDVETHAANGTRQTYHAERVRKRCEVIGYAIDARRQRFPDETPHSYPPHAEAGKRIRWDEAARREIRGYHFLDLFI